MEAIRDEFGRTFKTLRVSLINTCNMSCVYCSHSSKGDTVSKLPKKEAVSYNELAAIIKNIHELTPLQTIRLTGGEPTLYKDLIPFITELKQLDISAIKMTSNGYLLKKILPELKKAGLSELNISLDAVSVSKFKEMSGLGKISNVFESIDLAIDLGIKVKLNMVVMKKNEDQILPILRYANELKIIVRFLELMRMGPMNKSEDFENNFVSKESILNTIAKDYIFFPMNRVKSSTSEYWKTTGGNVFGVIANESDPFCNDCDRLRLDSYGNIFGCLSTNEGIAIEEVKNNQNLLSEKLKLALKQKQAYKFVGSEMSMLEIGG